MVLGNSREWRFLVQQPARDPGNNYCVGLQVDPAPVEPSDNCNPGQHLDCNLVVEDFMPGFLDPENSDNDCCCFKPRSMGVICYAAIDDRTHFSKYYFST